MPEGLYRGWDELRSVSLGQQAGLRVIVLFTDGSGNVFPGFLDASGVAKGVFSGDFPKVLPDPNNATTNTPSIQGVFQTETGAQSPSWLFTPPNWNSTNTSASLQYLPNTSAHTHHRSAGIPVSFALQSNSLKVNGVTQSTKRGLRNFNNAPGVNKYPAEVFNIRNAVTNLTEIIADAARSDTTGDHKIRIFAIGMGDLVKMNLGTIPEIVGERADADRQRQEVARLQLGAARGQVLLRADRRRPRSGVPAAAGPDHQAEQVAGSR